MEYLVVLIAALFHAIWNSWIKGSQDKLLALTSIRFVGLVFGLVIVITQPMLDLKAIPFILAAASVHYVYYYCLLNAYHFGDFSQVYPISRGIAPLIVFVMGLIFVGEKLTQTQLFGTLLISLGILCLAWNKEKFLVKPILFAIATGCCIAGYTFFSGLGVRASSSVWVYAGWLEALTGLGVVIFSCAKKNKQIIVYVKQNWKFDLIAGILSVSAYVAAIWAMSRVAMAPVAALRETSIIFAAIIGAFFMQEKFAAKRMIASSVVAIGVVVLGKF